MDLQSGTVNGIDQVGFDDEIIKQSGGFAQLPVMRGSGIGEFPELRLFFRMEIGLFKIHFDIPVHHLQEGFDRGNCIDVYADIAVEFPQMALHSGKKPYGSLVVIADAYSYDASFFAETDILSFYCHSFSFLIK